MKNSLESTAHQTPTNHTFPLRPRHLLLGKGEMRRRWRCGVLRPHRVGVQSRRRVRVRRRGRGRHRGTRQLLREAGGRRRGGRAAKSWARSSCGGRRLFFRYLTLTKSRHEIFLAWSLHRNSATGCFATLILLLIQGLEFFGLKRYFLGKISYNLQENICLL